MKSKVNFYWYTIFLSVLLLFFSFTNQKEDWDTRLQEMGFVDVQQSDSTIHIYLFYATSYNFMNEAVYKGITKAWLHKDAYKKLYKAQQLLKKEHPEYALMVFDAARPFEIQCKMWEIVKGTKNVYYVANPSKGGGLHNYGMAVDVTIVDTNGFPIDMGTVYDFFGEEAHTNNEKVLVETGKISVEAYNNRKLLRSVMQQAGFTTVTSEWWHFNACSRNTARSKYKLIE